MAASNTTPKPADLAGKLSALSAAFDDWAADDRKAQSAIEKLEAKIKAAQAKRAAAQEAFAAEMDAQVPGWRALLGKA